MKTRTFVALVILMAIGGALHCQTLADYQFSTGHDASRWYTLDSTRNLIIASGSRYYRRSALETIGFDFPFADTSYALFSVTHDGNLRLGSELAISSSGNQGSPFVSSRAGTNNPKINFMGCAGYSSDTAFVHKQLFGTAPNRVLVVEFALQTYITSSRQSLLRWQVQMYENGDIQIVYPSQAPPISPMCNHQQGLCVDETDIWIVDQNHVATHYTEGCATHIPSGFWPDTNRYYRFNYPNGVCPSPAGVVAASIDTSSVTLSWNGNTDATSFAVEYATSVFTPGTGAGTQIVVNDTFATVTPLQSGTQYHFYVRSICSDGDTSNAAHIIAGTLTTEPVSAFPYFCDFESADDRNGWVTLPGNLTTNWFTGTAANNTPQGQYSLYISQDSGATNTGGDQWIGAFAYRDLNLVAGDWSVSFDWRAYGDWNTNSVGATNYYHYLRVFLVPSSVTFTSRTPPNFPAPTPHDTAVPAGWIDLNPTTHAFVNQSTWTTYTTTTTVPSHGCYHLVFYWETDGYDPPTDLPAAIDNVSIEQLACPQPHSLTAEATEEEILLSWHRGGSENRWLVRYGSSEESVLDTFYLATGLAFNTLYTFEVYSLCGGGDTSLATVASFRTAAGDPVSVYPYFCDFEDSLTARQWVTLGEGQPNQWYVGTAANNTPQGQKALYVSQDGGASNTYSGTARALCYAYRTLVLDTVEYVCSFDWRCQGDDDFHFMRAFIVPANDLPSSGIFPVTTTFHHNTVPAGWHDLNPTTHYMSEHSGWTTHTQTFSVADSGNYALLLMWENDDYTPNNPPAAVDNINIEPITCQIPTNLTANAMLTEIDLTWNAGTDAQIWLVEYGDSSAMTYTPSYTATGLTPNTEYVFLVRTLCNSGDTSLAASLTVRTTCSAVSALPFVCNFDNYPVGTGSDENFIPCWNRILNYGTFSPKVSSDFTQGNNCLYWNLTAGLLDDVIVVLPELDESIEVTYTELRFKAQKYDPIGMFEDPVLVVGVMGDPDNAASFSPVDTVIVSNSSNYVTYSIPMLSYEGSDQYVAFRGIVYGSNYASAMLLMDDVELYELQYCRKPSAFFAEAGVDTAALSWIPGGSETEWRVAFNDTVFTTQQPECVVRNLNADTEYIVAVSAICGPDDTSSVLTGRFRTLPRPQDPPDTTDCPDVTGLAYTQELPWADHAYEFTFYWSGSASTYEVRIENLDVPEYSYSFSTSDTSYYFDAEGHSGSWIAAVRSVCGSDIYGNWSDTLCFDTPICIGFDTPDMADAISLYPNPTDGHTILYLSGLRGTITVSAVDLLGREILSRSISCNGADVVSLPIEGLKPGVYFINIKSHDFNSVHRLIVK